MRRKKKTAKFFVCVLVLLLFLGLIIPAGGLQTVSVFNRVRAFRATPRRHGVRGFADSGRGSR